MTETQADAPGGIPSEEGEGYFLYHSIGMFQGKEAAMALQLADFAGFWSRPDDGQWERALGLRHEFMARWGELIGVPSGSLTTAESVTAALSSFVCSLPPRLLRNRRLLVAADCFPSLHFLLAGLSTRLGFTLDTVPIRQGSRFVHEEDFIARWQEDVGLALVTYVTSTTSHRSAPEPLIAHARAMGSLIGFDITQGVGILPFDAGALDVDFTVSTSLKWLCGAPGAGILHVRPSLLSECQPELRGWFSQENIFSWGLDQFCFASDARRFDHGTPSVVSAVASLPGLRWNAECDEAARLAVNRGMTQRLLEAADEIGLACVSPRDEADRGGSLMLALPEQVDATRLVAQLRQRRLFVDARGQILRLSPGPVTTEEGVEQLCSALKELAA